MSRSSIPRRTIVCHARPESFALLTQSILANLGYVLLTAEEYEQSPDGPAPDARVVDERRLGEVVEEPGEPSVPIILLTGRHGATGADSRVVAAVKRPAGLHDLYRVLQQVLEDHPRTAPRVPTHLRTSCGWEGREWEAAILSLSENGCLLRSSETLPLGTRLRVAFELPGLGRMELEAEAAYQLLPDVGLVFSAAAPSQRDALQAYVKEVLARGAAV